MESSAYSQGVSCLPVPHLLEVGGTESKTPRGPCYPSSVWTSLCAPMYTGLGVRPAAAGH